MKKQTSPKKLVLEEAVERFVRKTRQSFSLLEAAAWILPRLRAEPTEGLNAVEAELDECRQVFFGFEEKELYIPRRLFFEKSRFLIKPTGEELENGWLVPGHRFIPFVAADVFPPECRLVCANGKTVPRQTITMPLQQAIIYFTLFGTGPMFEYLVTDHNENASVLESDPGRQSLIRLTVFDMRKVYAALDLGKDDYLLCTVRDWNKGIYDIECLKGVTLASESRREPWRQALANVLEEVFEETGGMTDAYEQLSLAFFWGPEVLRTEPMYHIGGFLAATDSISMQPIPNGAILWRSGESIDDAMIEDCMAYGNNYLTGRCDSLGAILNEIGLALTESELASYMRDALYRGEFNLDEVMFRCLRGRETIEFYDERQGEAFEQLLNELWEETQERYDRQADDKKGPPRARVLDILDRVTAWLRECDRQGVRPNEMDPAGSVELAGLCGLLSQMLAALAMDDEVTDDDFEGLSASIDQLENRINDVLGELKDSSGISEPTNLHLWNDKE